MTENKAKFDLLLKLLMIGDSGAGKTALTLRYANDSFNPVFVTTLGIDFRLKTLELDGKRVKLQIWDTAGQERFRSITQSYFKGAQGILVVYDITDRNSFISTRNWIDQINLHAPANVQMILVGNKCDRDSERVIPTSEGEALAKAFKIDFFETSAKEDINVTEAFQCITKKVKDVVMDDDLPQQREASKIRKLSTAKDKQKGKCC